jgi:hypothetical protein
MPITLFIFLSKIQRQINTDRHEESARAGTRKRKNKQIGEINYVAFHFSRSLACPRGLILFV